MNKFKEGDSVRVKNDCSGTIKGEIYILGYGYSDGEHPEKLVARKGVLKKNGSGCGCKDNWELINSNQTTNMKKRYILLKEMPDLKKGAIMEEECEDGIQGFTCITPELYTEFNTVGSSFSRKLVTNNPKWFQEVTPLWVSADKLEQVEKILK